MTDVVHRAQSCGTAGLLKYDFLTDLKSSILGVWAAPCTREAFQKDGGLRFPTFLEGILAARGRPDCPDPQIDDFRCRAKGRIPKAQVYGNVHRCVSSTVQGHQKWVPEGSLTKHFWAGSPGPQVSNNKCEHLWFETCVFSSFSFF